MSNKAFATDKEEQFFLDYIDTLAVVHRLRRGLSEDLKLLQDALHAIRNDRLEVADDFVDRVIASIRYSLNDTAYNPKGK